MRSDRFRFLVRRHHGFAHHAAAGADRFHFAALITGIICLQSTGVYFIMITLAFNQMIFYFFVALQFYGGDGLQILTPLNVAGFNFQKGSVSTSVLPF